jgi:putative hemin transport protein
MIMNTTLDTTSNLKQAWEGIQKAKPGIRIRDAAASLNCSEAELLATTVNDFSVRLEGDWTKLVERLPELGRVMSLTRNDSCVLEHKGPFQKIDIIGTLPNAMATVIGPIESRIFFKAWKFG